MKYKIFMLSLVTLLTTVLSAIKVTSASEKEISAQTVTRKRNVQRVVFIPPKEAKPKHTTGGASRDQGKCPQDTGITAPYLTAVLPSHNKALTSQASPTLLVYLPKTSAQKAFFSISEVTSKEQNQDNHYQTFLPIEKKSGVMQLTLPEDAPKLEVGKTYKWSYSLICNNSLRPDSPRVEGIIERVSVNTDFEQQLKTSTSLEKAVLYGQGGLWYDSVASLTKAYHEDPHNLLGIWQELLSSEAVGLEELSRQALLTAK